MNKITKITLIVLAFLFVLIKGVEFWIESNFEAQFNSNPERAYNIGYANLDLDTFFKGVTLEQVTIKPVNPKMSGNIVNGKLDYANLDGLGLIDLLFNKSLNIDEIAFGNPKFEITLSTDTIQKSRGNGLQSMFGDILSNININSLRIDNGSIVMLDPVSNAIKGQVKRLNVLANGIDTDAVKLDHIIPFEMDDLEIALDSIQFELNDYTHFGLGSVNYNLKDKKFVLKDILLNYSIDWVEVSKKKGLQTDVIELDAKEIVISEFESSPEFYQNLDLVAQKVAIDSLNIKLQRNKNIPRPKDTAKPTFQGMINAIPILLLVDSLQISNSSIVYAELGLDKSESGAIKIQDFNAIIDGITNMPKEQERYGQLDAQIQANLLGQASINATLNAPYNSENFTFTAAVGPMNLVNITPTLEPLAGLGISSGQMRGLRYTMNAGVNQSQNNLIFDYTDLKVNVFKQHSGHKDTKRGFLSAIANGAIRNDNLPSEKVYLTANYVSYRNKYRSPVNYIIKGLFSGFTRIVPGRLVQKLIN